MWSQWALRSTAVSKASGCNEIPAELFTFLVDYAIKVLHSLCQEIWKTQQWPQDWKRSILIPFPKKGSIKECANCRAIVLISCASKVMLKILCARLWHYVNQELPFVQTGFRKGRGARDQIASICWIIEKQRNFRKTSLSVSSTTLKLLTVWITTNCGKLLERWEYHATWPVSWETSMWAKKQHLEPGMEQLIGSRLRKEYDRAIRCHPVCLPYVLSTSWDILGWVSY